MLGERDVRRRDAVPLVVGDDLDASALVDPDARVGGPQVDADDGAEGLLFLGVVGLFRVGLLGAGREAEGRGGERWSWDFFFWSKGKKKSR